jgi:hypothetical protein
VCSLFFLLCVCVGGGGAFKELCIMNLFHKKKL